MLDWTLNAIADGIHQAFALAISQWVLLALGGIAPILKMAVAGLTGKPRRRRNASVDQSSHRSKRARAVAIRAPLLMRLEGPFYLYKGDGAHPPKCLYVQAATGSRRANTAAA